MPFKAAHITPVYPPYAGGIGVMAQMMAEGLAGRGWEADVYAPPPHGRGVLQYAPTSAVLRVVPLESWFKIGNAAVVPQLRNLDGYDIIHLHYPFFGGAEWMLFNTSIQRNHKKTKFILQYHHDADARGLKGVFFRLYDCIILPRLIERADSVIVSSMDYARHSRVARHISEKFVEIPFGVDTDRYTLRDSRFQIPDSSFTILFVGSLDRAHWFKGLDVLLRALAHVPLTLFSEYHDRSIKRKETLLRWRLVVTGEGDMRMRYERQARALGLADTIEFLGTVPHAQLPEVYRRADCFVFPSVSHAEAFGLVVLEAMASGVPVIVSDLPGVRTLVDEGVNGLRVRPGDAHALADAIGRLMRDRAWCHEMGVRSREKFLKRYTYPHMLDQLTSCYEGTAHQSNI